MELKLFKEKQKYVDDSDNIKQMNFIQKTGAFFTSIILLIIGIAGLAIVTSILSIIFVIFNH